MYFETPFFCKNVELSTCFFLKKSKETAIFDSFSEKMRKKKVKRLTFLKKSNVWLFLSQKKVKRSTFLTKVEKNSHKLWLWPKKTWIKQPFLFSYFIKTAMRSSLKKTETNNLAKMFFLSAFFFVVKSSYIYDVCQFYSPSASNLNWEFFWKQTGFSFP